VKCRERKVAISGWQQRRGGVLGLAPAQDVEARLAEQDLERPIGAALGVREDERALGPVDVVEPDRTDVLGPKTGEEGEEQAVALDRFPHRLDAGVQPGRSTSAIRSRLAVS
jgi:hypothetical protein